MLLQPSMTKTEIDKFLQGKGDFVQIDHLGRFVKEPIAMDTKKFVFLKLATLYEKAKMLSEAAKMYNNVADLSILLAEKIKFHMKETELYVKSGAFDKVEQAMKKALGEANSKEREEISVSLKQFLRAQAETLEKESKRNHATKYYEKLLEMRISEQERQAIREKLLDLYRRTGKMHEALVLEKSLGKP